MQRVRSGLSTMLLVLSGVLVPIGVIAAAFATANPQTPDLFDLGDVPEAVGRPAGYGCLYEPDTTQSS